AEDGIRDFHVTGVQTCALPILVRTFDEMVDAADLEPPDDEHDPEGTTAYERAQVTSLARAARTRLHDLDRAVAAVDDDEFGSCEDRKRVVEGESAEGGGAARRG